MGSLITIGNKLTEFRAAIADKFPESLDYWCVSGTCTNISFKLLTMPVTVRVLWDSSVGWISIGGTIKNFDVETPLEAMQMAAFNALASMEERNIATEQSISILTEVDE